MVENVVSRAPVIFGAPMDGREFGGLYLRSGVCGMESTSLKAKMEHLIHDLPEDASIEDAMENLFVLYKIEKGIEQADSGLTVSHEEVKRRLAKWLD
jgi:predicted transcriptional regulator